MIDFACKRFEIDKIIKCGLNLSKADFKVMKELLTKDDYVTTEELVEKLGFNISTVQRAVKKLTEKKLVIRSQENLSGGGYKFLYKVRERQEVRKILIALVRKWSDKVEETLVDW